MRNKTRLLCNAGEIVSTVRAPLPLVWLSFSSVLAHIWRNRPSIRCYSSIHSSTSLVCMSAPVQRVGQQKNQLMWVVPRGHLLSLQPTFAHTRTNKHGDTHRSVKLCNNFLFLIWHGRVCGKITTSSQRSCAEGFRNKHELMSTR